MKSPFVGTWKLFLLGCFCGGLLSLLFIDKTQHHASLSAANNAIVELNPLFKLLDKPTSITTSTVPLDVTIRPPDVPPPSISTIFKPNATTYPPEVPSPIISPMFELNVTTHPLEVRPSIISPVIEPSVTTHPLKVPSPIISPIYEPKVAIYFPEVPPTISPVFEPNVTDISKNMEKPVQETKKECDMFDGKWVYMADDKPSYNAMTCPFLEVGVSCQKNGRSDFEYEKWRWEARDCDIPLFDGRDMLEKLRDKRMIIVGDSINRNMWESLACLIYSSVPSSRTTANLRNSAHRTLKAKDYNFTIEFYMSPFLVELDQKHESGRKVLILDRISPFSKMWLGADIMVFNSGHWWNHNNKIKSWELFEYKGKLTEEMPRDIAFKRGMKTWASWIKKNVDTKKTSVYFRSVSPTHDSRKYDQWCYNVTQPIMDDSYVMGFPKALIDVVESLIKGMNKLRVKYLNITKLSQYRIDAHPSLFTKKVGDDVAGRPDCSHWCLPGLPDTWNRLLYASILFDTTLEDMLSS